MHTSNNGLVPQLTVQLGMRTSDGVIKAIYTKHSVFTSTSVHVVNLFPQLFASATLFKKLLWCQWVTKKADPLWSALMIKLGHFGPVFKRVKHNNVLAKRFSVRGSMKAYSVN